MNKFSTAAMMVVFSASTLAGDMNKEKMTHGEQVHQDFISLDKDANGLLNQEEVNANPELAGAFVDIDLNDNKDIDLDEFLIYRSEATAAGTPEKSTDKKSVK